MPTVYTYIHITGYSKRHLKQIVCLILKIDTFTRAPPGGGLLHTPLRDIRHSSETVLDIDIKLSVPYGTKI